METCIFKARQVWSECPCQPGAASSALRLGKRCLCFRGSARHAHEGRHFAAGRADKPSGRDQRGMAGELPQQHPGRLVYDCVARLGCSPAFTHARVVGLCCSSLAGDKACGMELPVQQRHRHCAGHQMVQLLRLALILVSCCQVFWTTCARTSSTTRKRSWCTMSATCRSLSRCAAFSVGHLCQAQTTQLFSELARSDLVLCPQEETTLLTIWGCSLLPKHVRSPVIECGTNPARSRKPGGPCT